MTQATTHQLQIPPEVVRYLQGPSPQSQQFDFLVGHWAVAASAFKPDGSLLRQYSARWDAQHLNDGRMVMDDFRAQAPNGQDISSFVTLRTWSEATNRWEITGLAAFQPAMNMQWHGRWTDGEMHLEAAGKDPSGTVIQTRIRYFDIASTTFTWESHVSRDGGNTWHKTATLLATRVQ